MNEIMIFVLGLSKKHNSYKNLYNFPKSPNYKIKFTDQIHREHRFEKIFIGNTAKEKRRKDNKFIKRTNQK